MDQNEGNKWSMPWYDWSVFLLPILLFVGLGLESAFGPAPLSASPHHDFRAAAHWFDPVFFQWNLVMALLTILIVPSLALFYIQNMTYRKERLLYRDVPPERRSEVRRRMARRASFSAYRGSVWLTMTVVLLGIGGLLFLKPDLGDGLGLNIALSANGLLIGPFFELFGKNHDAYYSHLFRSVTAFQFGFLGAYIYFLSTVTRAYFTLDLTSHTFVDGAIRMMAASITALVVSFCFGFFLPTDHISTSASVATQINSSAATSSTAESLPVNAAPTTDKGSPDNSDGTNLEIPVSLNLLPIISFFFGFYPKRATLAIERIALKAMKNIVPSDSYRALPLSMLAGMSYSHELRLEREGFDNVENLINADAVDLAIRTCFSYTQLKQWIDQAWLAARLREDYSGFVLRTGIESKEELHCFLCTSDSAKMDGVGQLVSALTADPVIALSWKVRLTALKMMLDANNAPSQKVDVPHPDEPKPD
ncbi:MAG: hypothetical protein ABIN99_09925 [Nitrosospira sp.]